jgi:hypothetical protein
VLDAINPLGRGKEKEIIKNNKPIQKTAAKINICPVYGRSFLKDQTAASTKPIKTANIKNWNNGLNSAKNLPSCIIMLSSK